MYVILAILSPERNFTKTNDGFFSFSKKLGNATIVSTNPVGVKYKATLPAEAFFKSAYPDGGNIQGDISAEAAADGKGVVFTIKLSNLPKEGGPLRMLIHPWPVLPPYTNPARNSLPPSRCPRRKR